MLIILLVIILFILSLSLGGVWTDDHTRRPTISEHVLYFASLYATVLIGFALLYLVLTINGMAVIQSLADSKNYLTMLTDSLYVSAMTLFTVGYGDFVPTGIGKWIAISEAFIGYLIPTSFVLKVVMEEGLKNK
ncbi:hypothetical protein GCM10008967_34790 [Bacillus carboniphilus]|uniref:Potassium channel domain-containing protein n=1 Tax=Bacillus carboniphilus TaxID=86663 RepID=A0ABP3GE36_9BACI